MLFVSRFYCKQNKMYSFPVSEAFKNLALSRILLVTIYHSLKWLQSSQSFCDCGMHSLLKNRATNVPIMFPLSLRGSSSSFYLTSCKIIQFLLSSSWIKFIKSLVWSEFLQQYPKPLVYSQPYIHLGGCHIIPNWSSNGIIFEEDCEPFSVKSTVAQSENYLWKK